ncbi:MAG TPA: hypothetical protein PK095_02680 [Myxococcota bacterium]|nr:hypothetical protein [Myxococcota bacterium]
MNARAALSGIALLLTSALAPPAFANASRPERQLREATERVIDKAREVVAISSYGFDDTGDCFLGAWLRAGKSASMSQVFEGGREYLLIGGGTDETRDLDIKILDDEGKVVAADTASDATPIVRFTPASRGKYTIRLEMHATNLRHGDFGVLAILRDGAYVVPMRDFESSFGGLFESIRFAASTIDSANLYFQDAEGEWCLYGRLLAKSQRVTWSGLDFDEDQRYLVLVSADSAARDVDVVVTDRSGREVASDTDPDARPVAMFQPRATETHRVQLRLEDSDGLALVAMVVLRADADLRR